MKYFLLLVLFCISVGFTKTPFEANGQLHVDPTTGILTNIHGERTQLRGMSSHGLQWYGGVINEYSIHALRENWGADVIRLSTYIQEGGYEKGPRMYERFVDRCVEYATDQGMYVVIDFHMLAPGNPWENIEHAVNFFTHMASTHYEKENIFYEICNEPNNHGGGVKDYYTGKYREVDSMDVTWDIIKSYADSIVPIIRRYDDHNIILVGTPNWCQDVNSVIGNRVDDANLMYTTHFYAASHKEYVRENTREALNANIPVFVSEFGMQRYDGNGANDSASTLEWFALLDSFSVSWVNWNFSDHRFTGAAFNKNPSSAERLSYEFYADDNNLKESGKWIKKQMQRPDSWEEPAVSLTQEFSSLANCGISVAYSADQLVVSDLSQADYSLSLFSLSGRVIFETELMGSDPTVRISLPVTVAKGVYLATITDGVISTSSNIVIF